LSYYQRANVEFPRPVDIFSEASVSFVMMSARPQISARETPRCSRKHLSCDLLERPSREHNNRHANLSGQSQLLAA
jgi:hypothetical protein